MLRNAFLIFITGWIAWFWTDKPRAGLNKFLQADDSMLVNFQRAFDLLKSGYPEQSFIYIWNAHYLVLSLLGGIALTLMSHLISELLSQQRRRKRFKLQSPSQAKQHKDSAHSADQQ